MTTSGHFFSKLGNVFPIFEKEQGRPTPTASNYVPVEDKFWVAAFLTNVLKHLIINVRKDLPSLFHEWK